MYDKQSNSKTVIVCLKVDRIEDEVSVLEKNYYHVDELKNIRNFREKIKQYFKSQQRFESKSHNIST